MSGRTRRPHAVLDRLRLACGIYSDAVLADRLGLDPLTPRDCRRDGHVPYGAIVTAVRAGTLTVDLHWLLTGTPYARPALTPHSSPLTPHPEDV
jgi:hypothetical protein